MDLSKIFLKNACPTPVGGQGCHGRHYDAGGWSGLQWRCVRLTAEFI